jgi:LuxR family transcriptional regulator, quorum-sensing system regulator SdiA
LDTANDLLKRLRSRSPAGFAIALHIQFTTPRYLFQAYDKDWLDLYSSEGMVMDDPTVAWAFANTGTIRWSALAHDDPRKVLARAADHGLRYGLTVSLDDGGSRSMASFARRDREMSDLDIRAITTDLRALHVVTLGTAFLSPELHETLHRMSIFLTHG